MKVETFSRALLYSPPLIGYPYFIALAALFGDIGLDNVFYMLNGDPIVFLLMISCFSFGLYLAARVQAEWVGTELTRVLFLVLLLEATATFSGSGFSLSPFRWLSLMLWGKYSLILPLFITVAIIIVSRREPFARRLLGKELLAIPISLSLVPAVITFGTEFGAYGCSASFLLILLSAVLWIKAK